MDAQIEGLQESGMSFISIDVGIRLHPCANQRIKILEILNPLQRSNLFGTNRYRPDSQCLRERDFRIPVGIEMPSQVCLEYRIGYLSPLLRRKRRQRIRRKTGRFAANLFLSRPGECIPLVRCSWFETGQVHLERHSLQLTLFPFQFPALQSPRKTAAFRPVVRQFTDQMRLSHFRHRLRPHNLRRHELSAPRLPYAGKQGNHEQKIWKFNSHRQSCLRNHSAMNRS